MSSPLSFFQKMYEQYVIACFDIICDNLGIEDCEQQ